MFCTSVRVQGFFCSENGFFCAGEGVLCVYDRVFWMSVKVGFLCH